MSVTQKAACAIFFLHFLGGCNSEGNDEHGNASSNNGSQSPSGKPSISEFCAEQQHYEDTFSGPPYPLELTVSGSDIDTINGDFENPNIAATAIEHNVDPMYVYAGSGSAKLVDREFNASFPDGEQDLLDQSQQVTFWIYSSSDEPAEYRVEAGGQLFHSISNDSGWGFSFISSGTDDLFTIPPHEWTPVSLDVAGAMGNCLSWLKIAKQVSSEDAVDDTVEFYIDDIQFHLETQ